MDLKLENEKCSDCRFFKPVPLQVGGLCRRNPPHPVFSQQGISSTYVPVNKNQYCCGEFKHLLPEALNQ